jgi:dynactin complex subunit
MSYTTSSSILPPLGTRISLPPISAFSSSSTSSQSNLQPFAILRYVGSVSNRPGVFCGLELCNELANKGKNDGDVGGVKYFDVQVSGSGLFVPLRKVVAWISAASATATTTTTATTSETTNRYNAHQDLSSSASPTIGTFITTTTNTESSTRYDSPIDTKMGNMHSLTPTRSPSIINNVGMNVDVTTSTNELRRHINILEKRLTARENDLRELGVQLDELDASMCAKDARLKRKEDKFIQYKVEKEREVELLMDTIAALEKRVGKEGGGVVGNGVGGNDEEVQRLQKLLEERDEEFTAFKAAKNREINALRAVEMDKYKLELEVERLKSESVGALQVEVDELMTINETLKREIDELRLDMQLKDTKIENLELQLQRQQQNHQQGIVDLDENGGLKVYVPPHAVDASAGREDFCTYCDKDGHSTSECPYEKDNLEVF